MSQSVVLYQLKNWFLLFFFSSLRLVVSAQPVTVSNEEILAYIADPQKQDIEFFWKNDKGEILESFRNLKAYVESKGKELIFATNAGMFMQNLHPLGLFIQHGKTVTPLNTREGKTNFYLKPNGVFYITTDNRAYIVETSAFKNDGNVKFATQSGPMLVIDGKIHPAFRPGSSSRNVRNGVGILPDNRIVFAMSKGDINFYDFAQYFLNMGCREALYFDGVVSVAYLPEKNWMQMDGICGVMIGVTRKKTNK